MQDSQEKSAALQRDAELVMQKRKQQIAARQARQLEAAQALNQRRLELHAQAEALLKKSAAAELVAKEQSDTYTHETAGMGRRPTLWRL